MARRQASNQDTRQNNQTTREHASNRNNQSGRGWHGDPEGHAAAGRKGGQKVSSNRDHMAEIGRKGGEAVSRNRDHMAEIGRKGGQARGGGSAPSSRGSNNGSRS